jgi:CubicO group peptidase (beta-lactamase class C family)
MGTARRTRATITALVLGALMLPAAGSGDAFDSSPARVDTLLQPILQANHVPALGGAVVRDGRLAALGAVGVRKLGSPDRVTGGDCWHLGSCTKAMTATLLAGLVEDGTLSWTTTIGETFPTLETKIRREWLDVTLEQLLSNRSGLPDDRKPDAVILPELRKLEGPMQTQRQELVRLVLHQKPAARPGTTTLYSNYGYAIAGAMAEARTKTTWEDLMRERLFTPLGMTTAGFGAPGDPDHLSQPRGHRGTHPVEPGPWADNPAVMGPAGTVHCSLPDWGRFVAAELAAARGDTTFLGADAFRRLTTPVEGSDYAYGWMTAERPWANGRVLTHAGSNTMWYSVVWIAPARDFAVLAVCNQGGESAARACDEAAWALIQHTLREDDADAH